MEGQKAVLELHASSLKCYGLYAVEDKLGQLPKGSKGVTESELRTMSALKNPNGVLGVFYIPEEIPPHTEDWIIALDGVQDPGNLGTIIRLCDWFGFSHLLCGQGTVDCFNPKVLQATMGSIARVKVSYVELPLWLSETDMPVYGTFMMGRP